MYLDKTKLRELIKKTGKLDSPPATGTNTLSYNTSKANTIGSHPLVTQLGVILASLSAWLTKNPSLTNGSTYGKKLAELPNKLPDPKRQSWVSDKEMTALCTQALTLMKTIDKENKNVFIVHGRDTVMRNAVENALHGLNIPTVVLVREEDQGQTVIEKFEKQAARCEYAVILCSADDEGRLRPKGRSKETPAYRYRARQNVVLELGYFLAKVGRKNLFVLQSDETIEPASDFHGVICQTFNKSDVWKRKLVSELRAAGFKFSVKAAERI